MNMCAPLDPYQKPIRVLNNKAEIDSIIEAFLGGPDGPDYKSLYRANVNKNVTQLELSIMDIRYLKRACCVAIWQNNYKGIVAQSKKREAYLRAVICRICGISRTALWYIIKTVNPPKSQENGGLN